MTKVRVGKRMVMNVSRRSLCDNCGVDVCLHDRTGRVTECPDYMPVLVAFKKCKRCGRVFEVSYNIRAIDAELCSRCNEEVPVESFREVPLIRR